MKVIILTEGGKDIGFGHITRCLSLYQAFEEKGITSEIIACGDDSIIDLLEDRKYQIFDWISQRNKLFKLANNSDVIIIDSYLADISLYQEISTLAKIAVYMDDTKRLDYPKGIVVNGGVLAEDLDYSEKDGTIYLLGSQFAISRKTFWSVLEKEVKEKMESIMITFGGDDARNMTPKILKLLVDNYSELIKKVIIGKGFQGKNIQEIESLKKDNIELIYYPDVERMKYIMVESDIAISAGGQTLYELVRVGVPTVVIAVAENQLNNIHGWQKAGFIEYAGWYNDENLLGHIEDILNGLNYKKRKAFSIAAQRVIDGQGTKRVVDRIIAGCRNISGGTH